MSDPVAESRSDSFLIDGPGYTDRDREMFCLGYEMRRIDAAIGRGTRATMIHAANADRARHLAEASGVTVSFEAQSDPAWTIMRVVS